MPMKHKIKIKNEKMWFTILIAILIILLFLYYNLIISVSFARNAFANNSIKIAEENEETIFSIQKILLYSSADAVDNSENESLKDLNILQYTDLAIYIDNMGSDTELTDENTIKSLYIDNINISTNSNIGDKYLNYKNPLKFGKSELLDKPSNDRIDFKIVNTNSENENNDYSTPTFFTDCSNPISLGYMNKDLLVHYSVSDNANTVSFNGKILKEANINLDDINYALSFRINIVNNLNQKFIYTLSLDIDLNDDGGGIYNGYIYRGKNTNGEQYKFFKEV